MSKNSHRSITVASEKSSVVKVLGLDSRLKIFWQTGVGGYRTVSQHGTATNLDYSEHAKTRNSVQHWVKIVKEIFFVRHT